MKQGDPRIRFTEMDDMTPAEARALAKLLEAAADLIDPA